MEDKAQQRQVIIVGGGFTGLTLALCLQQMKIDYVLLEAYGSMTPNVGASILLYPHGQRILDQLGVLEDLRSVTLSQGAIDYRDGITGKSLQRRSFGEVFQKRHGYPPLWSSRYHVVRMLYDAISEKERLLVNKRVTRIDSLSDYVLVKTEDGSVYQGQIVVGCDGVHSTTRKEIWRNAELTHRGFIPKVDQEEIGCEFGCFFAASKCTQAILEAVDTSDGAIISLQDGFIVLGRGLDDEMYLFCIWALPKSQQKCHIDKIPKFTKEYQEKMLDRFRDVVFTDSGIRIQELLDNVRTSGITALPHYTLRKWSYGRMITIGDAVHKFNPVAGQGGNSCVESCAALVNALQVHLGMNLADRPSWPLSSLEQAFKDVESASVNKIAAQVETSQEMIRLLTWRKWFDKIMYRYLLPYAPGWLLLKPHSATIVAGNLLAPPFKQPEITHDWPYIIELIVEKDVAK